MARSINRAAADIGGTFTDVVLDLDGVRDSTKLLTTPDNPEIAVIEGVGELLDRHVLSFSDLDLFLHGTTLATNAIIERRGAVPALVTTEGFRDTLEIGTESRHDQYDIFLRKREPLVSRDMRFTIGGRIAASGKVLHELDMAQARSIGQALREAGTTSVAISLIHAYANAQHERHLRETLREYVPEAYVSLSSDVCPEIREYERTSTTVANAYVRPVMAGYLARLNTALVERGLSAPVFLMTSGGGLTTVEQAARYPIRLVESGPAGGAILGSKIAGDRGLDSVVSFDMGGTTAKICLISDGRPLKSRNFEIDRSDRFLKGSGFPVRIPVIEMVEIGAGGGSLARVDSLGRLAVGPESASSEPGPACYGRGGDRPTVTDSDLIMGRIEEHGFASGKFALDRAAAEAAVRTAVGDPLSLTTPRAASAVTAIVEENMANAMRVHAAEHGKDLRKFSIIAFGGAAPMHAAELARKLSLESVVVPRGAGVGSAIGFLEAPIAYEVVRSLHCRLSQDCEKEVGELVEAMCAEAREVVALAANEESIEIAASAFLRYVGQGHELEVSLPFRPDGGVDLAALDAGFRQHYLDVFGRQLASHDVEIMTWTVTAVAQRARVPEQYETDRADGPPAPRGETVFTDIDGREQVAPVYDRIHLAAGYALDGPLLVTENETNTAVPAGFAVRVTTRGDLELVNRHVHTGGNGAERDLEC